MRPTLNLVFHRIVASESEIGSRFDVDRRLFHALLAETKKWISSQENIERVRVYFDDNHKSALIYGVGAVADVGFIGVAAVPVESIGRVGHCSLSELDQLRSAGFSVVPHGHTHVALATYKNDVLSETPSIGIYRNRPAGRDAVLTAPEVLFQLQQSRSAAPFQDVSEFVLPYGLYNDSTIDINRRHSVFCVLTGCDSYLDCGEPLRNRYLITGDRQLSSIKEDMQNLSPRSSQVNRS
jgi:hypothetical protein